MSGDHFTASYICKCGERQFPVRWRRKGEDIVAWMETAVRPAMGEAHKRDAPFCTAPTVDLKLPMPEGTAGIGMPVQH